MRALEVVTVASVVVFLAVATYAFASTRNTFGVAGERQKAGVAAALDIQRSLADLDATFAEVMLVGDRADLGTSRQALLDHVHEQLSASSDNLVKATRTLDEGDQDGAAREIVAGLGTYQSHLDRALLLASLARNDEARGEYRDATQVMQATLLPNSQRLADDSIGKLNTTSDQQQGRVGLLANVVTVGVVACFGALIVSQLLLFRRTRRILNGGLAAATVLLASATFMADAGLSNASTNLRIAKRDAFDSAVTIRRARATVSDVRGDQLRWVLDRERAATAESRLVDQSQQLLRVGPGGATPSTYWTVAKSVSDQPDIVFRDPRYGGHLAEAYRSVSFDDESTKLTSAFTSYARFQDSGLRARETFAKDPAEATRISVDQSDFSTLDRELAEAVAINDRAFDDSINKGQTVATLWQAAVPLVALGCIALIIAGFRPRIAEYQRG